MTTKSAAEAKLQAKVAGETTERLIVLIDTMDAMPATTERVIVHSFIVAELESRMDATQRERYMALFDDEAWETTKNLSDTALFLIAFDQVAA